MSIQCYIYVIGIDVHKPNPNPNLLIYLLLGLSRKEIGVPDNWDRVHLWLTTETMALLEEDPVTHPYPINCSYPTLLVQRKKQLTYWTKG
jgi:hypothetical protein